MIAGNGESFKHRVDDAEALNRFKLNDDKPVVAETKPKPQAHAGLRRHRYVERDQFVQLQIELVHTTDDPTHGPIPPLGDGWHLARSANGVTLWRHIQLPLRSRLSVAAGRQVSARATTNWKGNANGNP